MKGKIKDEVFFCIILFYTGILNLVTCFNKNIETIGPINVTGGFRIASCIIGIGMIISSILVIIFSNKNRKELKYLEDNFQ